MKELTKSQREYVEIEKGNSFQEGRASMLQDVLEKLEKLNREGHSASGFYNELKAMLTNNPQMRGKGSDSVHKDTSAETDKHTTPQVENRGSQGLSESGLDKPVDAQSEQTDKAKAREITSNRDGKRVVMQRKGCGKWFKKTSGKYHKCGYKFTDGRPLLLCPSCRKTLKGRMKC